MSHVAWSCDGKKLAAVGIDKIVRVWQPEKSVSFSYSTCSSESKRSSHAIRWRFALQPYTLVPIRTRWITFLGTLPIRNYLPRPARRTARSYFGMPVVRYLVARPFVYATSFLSESRSTQQLPLKLTPTQIGYAPDGKTLFYVSAGNSLYFLELGRNPGETKDTWRTAEEGRTVRHPW